MAADRSGRPNDPSANSSKIIAGIVIALIVAALALGFVRINKQQQDREPVEQDDVPAGTVDLGSLDGVLELKRGSQQKVYIGNTNSSARIYYTIAVEPDPAVASAELTSVRKQAQAPGDDTGYAVLVVKANGTGESTVRFGRCPIEYQRGGDKCLDRDGEPVWDEELKIVVR